VRKFPLCIKLSTTLKLPEPSLHEQGVAVARMSLLAKAERCLLNQRNIGSRINAFIPSEKRISLKDFEEANTRREEGKG